MEETTLDCILIDLWCLILNKYFGKRTFLNT